MSVGMILSSLALGISLVVTAFKLGGWLLHSDPRTLVRAGQWLVFAAAVAAVPSLVLLLIYQQWTGAMVLGAAMLAVPAVVSWRAAMPRRRFRPLWREGEPPAGDLRGDFGQPPPDPELARRAAIVLEDYLASAGLQDTPRVGQAARRAGEEEMSAEEALEVLGLEAGASAAAVRAAHRRLQQLVHPDRGGSTYLASKVNQAKDVLLSALPARRRTARKAGQGEG